MGHRKPSLAAAKIDIWRYLTALKKDGVDIRAVYLFGSFAEGKQHSGSDVDLLVSVRGFKNWIEAGGVLHKKLFHIRTKYPLDIIGHIKPRLDQGIPLEREVLRTGIRLI
jgi:predicted nucleotidyltransferase